MGSTLRACQSPLAWHAPDQCLQAVHHQTDFERRVVQEIERADDQWTRQ